MELDVVERTVVLKRLPPFADPTRIGNEVDMATYRKMLGDGRELLPLALRPRPIQRHWMLLTRRGYESPIASRTTYESAR